MLTFFMSVDLKEAYLVVGGGGGFVVGGGGGGLVVGGGTGLQIGFDDPGVQHFVSLKFGPQAGSVGGGKYVVGGLVGGWVGGLVGGFVITTGGLVVATVFGGSVNEICGVVYS